MTKRTISLVLVALLLTPVVAAPAAAATTPTVTTIDDASECDWTDALTMVYSGCSDTPDYNESAHSLETHTDAYTHLSTQEASHSNYLTVVRNYRQDLDSRAWMIAEAEMAEAYQNGSTQPEAEQIVRTEVGQYYTVKHHNLIDRWNTSVEAYRYSISRTDDQGLDRGNVTYHNFEATNGTAYVNASEFEQKNVTYVGVVNKQTTLANGTTKGARALQFDVVFRNSGNTASTYSGTVYVYPGAKTEWTLTADDTSGNEIDVQWQHTDALPPTSDYSQLTYLARFNWYLQYDGITEQENTTQNEVDTFINQTYADFDTGNLNATDLLSRVTIMEEYGVTGASENATFTDVTAALAATGLETPNLAETGYMNVTYTTDNGTTVYEHRKGMLAVRGLNGTWNTNGTTYHTKTITGPVMFARQDGVLHDLNGSFTIHGATSKDGNQIDEVTTEDLDYEAANTSELRDVINRTIKLQENITVHTTSGGGGGSASNSPTWPWDLGGLGAGTTAAAVAALLAIAAGAIGLILVSRP